MSHSHAKKWMEFYAWYKDKTGNEIDDFQDKNFEGSFNEWKAAWTPPEVEAMAQGGVRDEINVGSLWKDKSK